MGSMYASCCNQQSLSKSEVALDRNGQKKLPAKKQAENEQAILQH